MPPILDCYDKYHYYYEEISWMYAMELLNCCCYIVQDPAFKVIAAQYSVAHQIIWLVFSIAWQANLI